MSEAERNEILFQWPDPVQIQLSGSGGQGLILAGIILATAAIEDKRYVVQTQSYGPEARGGTSRAEVIIGSELIDYPHVQKPDILLALTQEACNKFVPAVSPNGLVIVDSLLVDFVPNATSKVFHVPIIETAKYNLGKELAANIVALGALNEATGLVSWDALEDAVSKRVPGATAEFNKRALALGRQLIHLIEGSDTVCEI